QDTIEENIRMGNTKATKEEIIKVAKMARCHDFIEELEQGYQTKIGDKGVFLSKGEAQRVSIARALLKNASILILDEATAYADAENELYIQQAIGELVKDKTVLIVAHRLWTIQNAHQIVVIDQGKIIEQGTHQTLLNKQGMYERLWAINAKSEEWKIKEEQYA
ncbi:MAG: ATP-binding cassette domain-containing protein, partial [Coprobacillaceae bacterium]